MQLSGFCREKTIPFFGKVILCSVLFALISEPLLRIWRNLPVLINQSPSALGTFALQMQPALFLLLFFIGLPLWAVYFLYGKRAADFVYRFRFLLALLVLILCVALDISGSSVHMWADYLSSASDGRLLGAARALRSDEWALNTPFAVSQCGNAFPYYSSLVRGTSTDMFIVYGQPVLDFAELFRPFHWGYLLFGASRGLAFFWCSRQLALMLVSFELGMLLTGQKKLLSLLFSVILSFSSLVQWWFAINGLVEMLVFGFLAVLLFHRYLHTKRFRMRLFCTLLLTECACGFVLTFYPAWMVPIGYLLAGLALWVILTSRKQFCFQARRDLPLMGLFLVLTAGSLSYILLYRSWNTIQLTLNTVYPGSRMELAPLDFRYFGSVLSNFFTPLQDMSLPVNSVENASLLSLMPLGIFLSIYVMAIRKKTDSLSLILLTVSGLLFAYVFMGFPEALARLTLLGFSTPHRALPILHLTQLLLLYRTLGLLEKPLPACAVLLLGSLSWLCVLLPACSYNQDYLDAASFFAGCTGMLLLMLLFLAMYGRRQIQRLLILCAGLAVFFTGVLVNPVQQGVSELTESAVFQMVRAVAAQDSRGLWIVEGCGYPMINLPITAGAPTINSTNVYPVLERWQLFDRDATAAEIYNRYAHIVIQLSHEETGFEPLLYPDSFTLRLNPGDLQTLEVKYILTSRDLEEFQTQEVLLTLLNEKGAFRVYRVDSP